MPLTILIVPASYRRAKMKREPHSKYTHAITDFRLQVVWKDGLVEDMTIYLPPEVLHGIEEFLVDMDDLRTQQPKDWVANPFK
jgi:hypothetical protein